MTFLSSRLLLGAGLLLAGFAPAVSAQTAPDPQAKAILDQSVAAQKALTALSATVTVQTTGENMNRKQTIALAFGQSGKAKAVVSDKTGTLAKILFNGQKITIYDVHAKQYVTQPVPAGMSGAMAVFTASRATLPVMLLHPQPLAQTFLGAGVKTTVTTDTLGGTAVDVINAVPPVTPGRPAMTLALAIGHEDHLLRRLSEHVTMERNGKTQVFDNSETVTQFSAHPALTASEFIFSPPAGVHKAAPQAASPSMHDPRLVPGARPFAIQAKDLAGKPLSLAQYKGKVVLLDFWATWCGPCVGEMPNVIAAYKTYHARGFDVVGLSLDTDRSALTSFIKQNGIPWRQVFDGKQWQSVVPRRYGVMAIPFGLLVGRDGRIAAVDMRGPELTAAIQKALAKN